MSRIGSWKEEGGLLKKFMTFRDEDAEQIEEFKEYWKSIKESFMNNWYGIVRIEKNGDIVLKDIDGFLEANKDPEEREEEEKDLGDVIRTSFDEEIEEEKMEKHVINIDELDGDEDDDEDDDLDDYDDYEDEDL